MSTPANAFQEFLQSLEDDEYKSDTVDTFKEVGEEMLALGMPPDDVVGNLTAILCAVRNEYGD